ncbi:MAG: hypothetical protein QM831_43690 [Kofleriaceae bacterium]
MTHEQRCASVKAVWHGQHDAGFSGDRWESLEITVDGHPKPWIRDLTELAPEARTTDLFSPDCKHALLLKSRGGPYHVIATEKLAAYLDGAPPDYVLDGERTKLPDGEGTTGVGVFRGGAWTSDTSIEYTWGCCDPPVTTKFELPH